MIKNLLLFLHLCLVGSRAQTIPYVSFMGEALPNHAYVNLSEVGTSDSNSVQCHTDLNTCCSSSQGVNRGDWYAPGDSRLPFNRGSDNVHQLRTDRRVELRRRGNSGASGIYCCRIAIQSDDNTWPRENVYVGLYASGGDITIVGDLALSRHNGLFILTCISTGGPATTVTWTRDFATITEGNETVLDDSVTATYTHTLTLAVEFDSVLGLYTCTVANSKPSKATASITLEGMTAPVPFVANQEGFTGIRLSWSPPASLMYPIGYKLHFNGASSGSVVINNSSADNYLLSDLQNGANYTILLLSKSILTSPHHSTSINLHKPRIIETSTTATSIYLSWSVPTGSEVNNTEVMWQRVTRQCSVEDEGSNVITDGTATNYTIEDVLDGSNYSMTVTVTNSAGVSVVSNMATAMTQETAPSAAPNTVSVSSVTSSNITVQWEPVDCIHRNGDLTHYSVRYGIQGDAVEDRTVETIRDSAGNVYNITGLASNTEYVVEVAAVNSAGTGVYSGAIYQLTLIEAPFLSVNCTSTTSILISWTAHTLRTVLHEVVWQTSGECLSGDHGSMTITDGSNTFSIFDVQENCGYSITVTATNTAGSTHSNTITAMTKERNAAPATAPQSLTIFEVSATNISIQWEGVDCNGDTTGYLVQYGVTGTGITQTISTNLSTTEATISRLLPSTSYSIEVAAVNGVLIGPYSPAITQLTEVEDFVLSVESSSATAISLSWTSAGLTVASYEVVWQRDTSGECPDMDDGTATISDGSAGYSVMNVEENSSYNITVTAINAAGSSVVSNEVTAMTPEAAPTATPTSLSVTEVTYSSITVRWGSVDCIHRNGDIVGYSVRLNGGGIEQRIYGNSSFEATITGLMFSTEYSVAMAAVGAGDIIGVYTPFPITAMTDDPFTITLLSTSNTSLSFSMMLEDGVTANSFILSYVNTNTQCFNATGGVYIAGTETMYTITDLHEGTEYIITVTAILSGRITEEVFRASTMVAVPSSAPASVSVLVANSSSITVQWGEVECIHRNGDIMHYSLRYGVQGIATENRTVEMVSDGGTYSISDLSAATLYTIEVAAINNAGIGVYSGTITHLTEVEAPVLSVVSERSTSISLSWTSAGSVVDIYEVMWYRDTSGECSTEDESSANITDGLTSYVITGVEEHSYYSISMRASNIAGSTEISNTVRAMTLQSVPSAAPAFLTISTVTSTSITVQWGFVECIHQNGDITGYSTTYEVLGSGLIQNMSVPEDTMEATLLGLMPSTNYSIAVAAVNSAGIGVYSNASMAETVVQSKRPIIIVHHSTTEHSTDEAMDDNSGSGSGSGSGSDGVHHSGTGSGRLMAEGKDGDGHGQRSGSILSNSYTLGDLESDTSYRVTITASNGAGTTFSPPIIITTSSLTLDDNTQTCVDSTHLEAAISGGIAAVVITISVAAVVITIIIVFLRNRRRHPSNTAIEMNAIKASENPSYKVVKKGSEQEEADYRAQYEDVATTSKPDAGDMRASGVYEEVHYDDSD